MFMIFSVPKTSRNLPSVFQKAAPLRLGSCRFALCSFQGFLVGFPESTPCWKIPETNLEVSIAKIIYASSIFHIFFAQQRVNLRSRQSIESTIIYEYHIMIGMSLGIRRDRQIDIYIYILCVINKHICVNAMIYYIINTLIIGFVGKFPFCRRFFQNGLFRTAFQKAFWVNAVIPRENHERHMVMCQKPSTLLVGGFNLSL